MPPRYSFLFFWSIPWDGCATWIIISIFVDYLLGWLCNLDTHFFSRPLEALHSDTRLAYVFKTSRGVAFRHPFGISFQDLSRHRIQIPVWHFFSRRLEASHSDTHLAFLFKTSRGVAFRHPFGIFLGIPRAVQRPMFHFIFLVYY